MAIYEQKTLQAEALVMDDNSLDHTAENLVQFFIDKDHGINVHLL